MTMDLNDKIKRVGKSFSFAIQGITHAFKRELNLRIHVGIAVLIIGMGVWLSISPFEWLVILLAIGGMIACELINTAIERLVDLMTTEYHPLAKQAKDVAAGAVFVFAMTSVIIGMIVFLPKLLEKIL